MISRKGRTRAAAREEQTCRRSIVDQPEGWGLVKQDQAAGLDSVIHDAIALSPPNNTEVEEASSAHNPREPEA
jgi:hypothetical protein